MSKRSNPEQWLSKEDSKVGWDTTENETNKTSQNGKGSKNLNEKKDEVIDEVFEKKKKQEKNLNQIIPSISTRISNTNE